jgi:hypothetical protein
VAVLLCVAACVAAASPHGARSTDRQALQFEVPSSGPAEISLLRGNSKVTTVGGAEPVTYVTSNGRAHPLTKILSKRTTNGVTTLSLAADEPGRTAKVTLRQTELGVRMSISLLPSSGVQALRLTLSAPLSAHFLGSGEREGWVDLRGTVQPIKVWNGCNSSAPASFFASTAGFGAYVGGDSVGRIAFPGAVDDSRFACDLGDAPCSVGPPTSAVRICLKATTATVEVFSGSPAQIVSDYASRVGRPQAPWLPAFALMKWRDSISGPAELFDDISQLRSRNLPVGWVILDNPWEQGARTSHCFGSLTFDTKTYPDPAGMIRSIHALGVRFMLWVSPQIRKKDCPAATLPAGWLTGDDDYYLRDLSNPAARADFVAHLSALAALGVDGFKGDRGDEVDLERLTLAAGPGEAFQDAYPRWYQQAVADAMRPYHRQWASLFRTSVPGSAAIVPGFVGSDTEHTWNGLLAAVRMAQTAGVTGEAMWGADIGGYDVGTLTPELFDRWAQFAALTPIFEVGGTGASAEFWQFGSDAVENFRAAATLHYELVPYLYELVREASVNGIPAVRALGLTWPNDAHVWTHETEFTVGDALLAAPIVDAAYGDPAKTSVYLPAGTWIDFFTGRRYAGGRSIMRSSTPQDFPLFVRVGTALPYNFRQPEVWADPWRVDDLARAGREGWLVAPKLGVTATALSGSTRLVATEPSRSQIEIWLSGAEPEQQLLVLPDTPICHVTVNGVPAPRTASATALKTRSVGWSVEPGAPHGVVIKAHVRRSALVVLTGCG